MRVINNLFSFQFINVSNIFLFSVGRLIVTKRAGFDDEFGNRDMEDISLMYKSKEGKRVFKFY